MREETMRVWLTIFIFLLTLSSSITAQTNGKDIFEKSCKLCHGADGKGNPAVAGMMKIEPERLNLTKQETKNKKDSELKEIVTQGNAKMKGFKDRLKPEEIILAVSHIRALQK